MGLGFSIKRMLENKNVSIKDLSKQTGLSYNTLYASINRDSNSMKMEYIQKIASALNVDLIEFIAEDPQRDVQAFGNKKEHYLIIKSYEQLNATGQSEAIKRIQELILIPKYVKSD